MKCLSVRLSTYDVPHDNCVWLNCWCTDTLIFRQISLPKVPSDYVAFTQRCRRIASFKLLADENLFSGVSPDINVSVH